MRITDRMVVDQALSYIQRGRARLGEAQKRVATGRDLHKVSDAPAQVERAMTVARELRMNENQINNIQITRDWMSSTEESLTRFNELIISAQNLALQGSSDTLGEDGRFAIAAELASVFEEAISVANSKHGDNYLFSGHQIKTEPFDIQNNTVIYRGDNAAIRHLVEPGQTMPVNVTGVQGQAGGIFFGLDELNKLRVAMSFGNMEDVSEFMENSELIMKDISASVSTLGARTNRVDRTEDRLSERQITLRALFSNLVDTDVAATITEMSAESQAYDMTLATAARIMPRSLLDFLR
jgi:flagellar hook-associated protein 3 FlgL